jgi:hypothetical protein
MTINAEMLISTKSVPEKALFEFMTVSKLIQT